MGDFGGSETIRKGPLPIMYYCPVPTEYCTGRIAGKEEGVKCHASTEEVHRCEIQYLKKQGYKRVGSREMESPDGSVLILHKKATRMKPGKGSRYMARSSKVLAW